MTFPAFIPVWLGFRDRKPPRRLVLASDLQAILKDQRVSAEAEPAPGKVRQLTPSQVAWCCTKMGFEDLLGDAA